MVQSVIVYSEIIPTILAVMGIFFLCSGVLDHNRAYTTLGVFLFILAVVLPFIILASLI